MPLSSCNLVSFTNLVPLHRLQQYKQLQKNLPLCLLPSSPFANPSFIMLTGAFDANFLATGVSLYFPGGK
jgi:hypothetical protein